MVFSCRDDQTPVAIAASASAISHAGNFFGCAVFIGGDSIEKPASCDQDSDFTGAGTVKA